MKILKLISRNALRHSLRTLLTILGVAIAVTAFCVIRSTVDAWYLQSEEAAPDRLITRNAVSLIFDLPLAYREKLASVPGVTGVSWSNWFGGHYVDPKNFFPKFAVDHLTYFAMYPEFVISPEQWDAFVKERDAVIVGRRLADRFGWQLGDRITIMGDIYPGDWEFVIRGIYTGRKETTDESSWFFRFDYLDERMKVEMPGRDGNVGSFVLQIADPSQAAQISEEVDALFKNSLAETKTETEEAFVLSFVAMSGQIILGLKIISFLVIGVIMLVMANTMAMSARERVNEYALLKTLGFRPFHLIGLVFGESVAIAALGGALGIALSILMIPVLEGSPMGDFLPKIPMRELTIILGATSALT
ncbi:MAG: ABC transporter permease, partial [candidate division Zixibacteria bacterium]|nr:ABC transporter permease [candidate division Zixibacteria bacterium]